MTGYEHKVVHVGNDSDAAAAVVIEVDVLGRGTWRTYTAARLTATFHYM